MVKSVDRDEFEEAARRLYSGEWSAEYAANYCGLSAPTFAIRLKQFSNPKDYGELPGNFFDGRDGKWSKAKSEKGKKRIERRQAAVEKRMSVNSGESVVDLEEYVNAYDKAVKERGLTTFLINAYILAAEKAFYAKYDDYGYEVLRHIKAMIEEEVLRTAGGTIWQLDYYAATHEKQYDILTLYYKILKIEGQHLIVDSYLLHLEKNRDPEDRFYLPRRKLLMKHGLVQSLQDLLDDKIDLLSISMPPGTGKTTIGEMFMSGFMGWYPELCNLFSSHSGHVTRMFYDVLCNIIGINLRKGSAAEYTWREIFPDVVIENWNANEQEINLGKFKPFKTITCRALNASQTGVTRCEGILYCDDLCSGIEMALSKLRLDKLWTQYTTDLKTRKKKRKRDWKCKELHIATRWSVWDVIGRIKAIYAGNERARFISIPDIDPETHESNFDYDYGVGFDVAYFEDIQKSLDEVTYRCLFKNEPVEREGILYNPDVIRRYSSLPCDQNGDPLEPDAIIAFCDTKGTGTDYNCLGVFAVYGKRPNADYYLIDVVFRNIDPSLMDTLNAQCLVKNRVQVAEFESNKEGAKTAQEVGRLVKEMGGFTAITTRYATANKETRIIVNSSWVISHVLFPYPESADYPDGYRANSEMGLFMGHLCSYSQLSKNSHDDAPDMISMLAIKENPISQEGNNTVEAVFNPFRGGGRY